MVMLVNCEKYVGTISGTQMSAVVSEVVSEVVSGVPGRLMRNLEGFFDLLMCKLITGLAAHDVCIIGRIRVKL